MEKDFDTWNEKKKAINASEDIKLYQLRVICVIRDDAAVELVFGCTRGGYPARTLALISLGSVSV